MKNAVFLILLIGLLFSTVSLGAETRIREEQSSKKAVQVEIYTTSWCPYCRKAEAFLKANNIDYVNYDIEKDQAAAARKKKLDRRKGVPLTLINGQLIYGFSEHLYRTALDLDE